MPIAGIYRPDDFGNPVFGHPAARARSRVSPAERARALPMPSLEWTPEVERATAHLYERVKNVISPVEWPFMAPYIKAINELKKTRDAVILAGARGEHNDGDCGGATVGAQAATDLEAVEIREHHV